MSVEIISVIHWTAQTLMAITAYCPSAVLAIPHVYSDNYQCQRMLMNCVNRQARNPHYRIDSLPEVFGKKPRIWSGPTPTVDDLLAECMLLMPGMAYLGN